MKKETARIPTILLVDKEGVLGESLLSKLGNNVNVVYVSSRRPSKSSSRIFFIPFKAKVPVIPVYTYDYTIVFYNGEKGLRDPLRQFIGKARNDNGALLYVASYKYVNELFLWEIPNEYRHAFVVFYGDLFGTGV